MNREAGRDYLVSFLFVPKFVYGPPGGSRQWAWRSRGGAGNPSAKNIERYVHKHNESLEIDGVNSHLGRRDAIYGGSIADQKTGETVAEWENKGIVNFYKSKPMFEVVGRELLKVAKELVASYPSNYFKSSSARSRANQSGLMDVENEDLTAPGLVAKLEEWQKEEGGVDGYVYDETAKALMKLGLRIPPGIKRASATKIAHELLRLAKSLVAFEWANETEGPHIRFKWGGHAGAHGSFELEEMPEKGKKTLRRLSGGLAPWTTSGGDSELRYFNVENLAHYAGVHRNMSYEQAKGAIASAAQKLVDGVNDGAKAAGKPAYEYRTLFSGPYEDTVHFLKVEPPDTKPFAVSGGDFSVNVKWTEFKTYSPNSDFQQSDPHYTLIVSSAPASARKLYKILRADPGALKSVTWSGLSDWLRKNGIGYETQFSVWN